MGGGVSAQLRLKYPNGPIINDRSFSSLHNTVIGLFGPFFGNAAGVILQALGWQLDAASAWSNITGKKLVIYHKNDGMIRYLPSSLVIKTLSDSTSQTLELKLKIFQFLDNNNEPKGQSVGLTQEEAIINSRQSTTGLRVVEVPPHQFYHCYPLNMHPQEWSEFVSRVKNLFLEQ
jgi:hypothetical protein